MVRCPSIGSCMILMQTLSSGDPFSRVTDFGSGYVLPLHSGEPEADGTGDRKTVRCPSIGSCMILTQTLSSGDPLSRVSISDVDLYFLYSLVNQRRMGQVTVKRSGVPAFVFQSARATDFGSGAVGSRLGV